MNITELKNDQKEFHAKLVINQQEIEEKLNSKLTMIAKTAKLDGFRPGKVPLSMIKKKYGASARNEIISNLLSENISKIQKKYNLTPVADPKIEDIKIAEGQDAEFTLKFELMPAIEMPDFKKIIIEKPVLEISEKEIDERLNKLKLATQEFDTPSKAKAKMGDQVTIDAVGYVDGEPFEGGKLENHKLVLGSGSFIEGFEKQLVGSKIGDKIDVQVTFPEKYHASQLAGKAAEFKTEIKALHKASEVKIDEEFAKKFQAPSVDELKKRLEEELKNSYSDAINMLMKMKLFDQLEKIIKFEPPKSLLEREVNNLKNQKEVVEDPLITAKSTDEQEKYLTKLATRRVRIGLVVAEYVKQHKITLEESDLRKALFAQTKFYPGREQELIEFYQKDKAALETLKSSILEEKGVAKIFAEEVQLKEKNYNKAQLEKILEEVS